VVDGIDFFEIETRRLLYKKAREHNLYVIGAAPVGFGASLLNFSPFGMSFDKYFDINDDMSESEKLIHFGIGLTPSLLQRTYMPPSAVNFKKHSAPSTGMAVLLCANIVTCEALKLILKKGNVSLAPTSFHFDPYLHVYKKTTLLMGNRGLLQRIKLWVVKKILKKHNQI